MDAQLVAWARAVKARQQKRGIGRTPALWLFTDVDRLGDPRAAAAALPPFLCGIVLRDDAAPGRARLAADLAAICRRRHLALAIAGDWRLAARHHAALHLRGGRRPQRLGMVVTSSAHGTAELIRAARAGARLVFLSPVFATASHPGTAGLGPVRWVRLARLVKIPVLALGGLDGARARRLPRDCAGGAAIGAFVANAPRP